MYNIVASGSKGNSVIYFDSIMVDCGLPFSSVKKYLDDIQIIMISHRHMDHLKLPTLRKIQSERPTIRFAAGEWLKEEMSEFRNVDILKFGRWYDYGPFQVAIVKLYHDVPNCGFRIAKDKKRIFHATDTAHLKGIHAKDYDLYAIEHNYNEETVYDIIKAKEDAGEFAHQKGSINSHLSDQQANQFFFENKGEHSELIRLHESDSK